MAISIVDADELVRGVLADQVRELDSDAGCFETLSECLEAPGPDVARVIVFGPSGNPAEIISWIEARSSSPRGFGAVMVVSDMSPEVLQRALRAEIDDVVSISAGSAELRQAVERAHDRIGARQPETPASPAVESGEDQRGRVVTVFSTKGGAGKSVLATNVAVALARRAAGPVVLVDADL
ncbi:MAG TPA: P-loop NTPase, partial [Acidimicrobiales bacterium]|nr:P-loop NTPase [Acidimicrobiales bacterium]